MSLSSPYQEHYYVADGVTTTFAFGSDFTALSSSYVKCIIYFDDGTNCVPTFNVDLTTGYISIVTLTKPDGTVLTVPPAGSIVRVFRDVPEQQNVTASQLQNYTAKQLEKIFDSVVAMIQEVSYSDLHKSIKLTETQRDVSVEQLTEEKDQSILYWDFDSRTIKATDYGQDEIVKSETVDRLVYLQPEGKIYFIPKGSNNPIAIGSATIHNDLGGRNAPDCHPESAITNLTTHLQELRDRDTAIEYKADQALSKAGEALTTANNADANATYAVGVVNTFDGRLTQAESDASDAKSDASDAKNAVNSHLTDYNNPHQVTKAQVGLGNVDNTADLDKPISTATQSELDDLQDQIDNVSGRGRFLALWNCATGLAESNPPESPYTYKAGDYFVVGTVSSADPAVNYKPDGSSYTTGVASTVVETGNVGVDDVYLYDGTNWLLQINTQKTVTFSAVAGSPYDNTNLGNALDAKADETNTINGAPLSNSETFFYGTSATAGLTAEKKVSIPSITTLKKGVVIFVKPDMTATTAGITLKLNDFTAYPIRYNGASISSTTDSIVWNQSYVSIFVFDGTYWQFAGHGYDKDTTYPDATDSVKGIAKLYTSTGNNTDGSMTQKAITDALPTVNDATLTIQKNGTDVATFTANSSTNATANITVPTTASDVGAVAANADITGATHTKITYDNKGLVTNGSDITLSDVTDITATAAEVNVLDGITASTTELNYVDGVTSSIQTQINSKPANTNRVNGAALSNSASVFYGTSDTAAATTEKEVSIPSITTLDTGTIIVVQPTITSTVANSTIKLNSFAAYPMRYNSAAITTSTDSVVWNQNYPSTFVFDGTYWVFAGHGLDSNTTYTLNYSVDAGQYTAGSGTYAVTRYSILAQKANGTWEKITATNASHSVGTSKSVNTSGFILNQLRYYGTTTILANGAKFAANVVYEKAASVDMRYSTNCGATTTWTLGDYIYLVGTIGADGLFYFDTTTWWSNALPTTNDGKLYIRLGLVLADTGYTMSFFEDRPVFYHDGTGIKEYKVADNKQDIISDLATIRIGASAGATAVQPGDLATIATTGDYDDLLNKPTIPTVNNPTITITQGGVAKGSFTLNQASGDTIALDAGGGGSVVIDNSTITKNGSDQLQAVATINANTAAGATNPVYDWVGTLAEYTSQAVATTHPEWLCYITDDLTAQAYSAYTQSQTDTLLAGKVSTGHEVIEFQAPTAQNNYTWYRKYADGFVEQGGTTEFTSNPISITLPVEMMNTNYTATATLNYSSASGWGQIISKSTTGISVGVYYGSGSASGTGSDRFVCWQVSGMAA